MSETTKRSSLALFFLVGIGLYAIHAEGASTPVVEASTVLWALRDGNGEPIMAIYLADLKVGVSK